MTYLYSYLIANLIGLTVWLALFLARKDVRKEMLFMSLSFGIMSPFIEPIYLKDWWRPLTITGTSVGIEDFLFGFFVGGVCAAIYEVIFRKKILIRKIKPQAEKKQDIKLLVVCGIVAALFLGGFFLFHLNTFYCSIIALTFGIFAIFILKSDLIIDSLISGALVVFVIFAIYSIVEMITPGWVRAFWYFKNTPGIIILNVPIDDLIWYFLAGAFLGPLYEFWKGGKIKTY